MIKQRTLKNTIRATGVGLHTGDKVYLTLHPGEPNSGICFRRVDLETPITIEARPENVGETKLSTTLVRDGVKVSTVEHLLSALAGLGIDNAIIDVSAAEVPIMDGSAGPFVFLLQSAGVVEQDVHADGLVYLPHLHGEVQRLQVLQNLVSGGPVGEGELAEGGYYNVVSVASSALVRRVV